MTLDVGVRAGLAGLLVLAAVFSVWTFSYWFWRFSLRPSLSELVVKEHNPGSLALEVRNRHFFGVAGEAPGEIAATSGATAMVLAGIVSTGSGKRGVAVILIDGRRSLAAEVGQEVAPGVVLTLVARDHVELQRDGRTVVLELAKKK